MRKVTEMASSSNAGTIRKICQIPPDESVMMRKMMDCLFLIFMRNHLTASAASFLWHSYNRYGVTDRQFIYKDFPYMLTYLPKPSWIHSLAMRGLYISGSCLSWPGLVLFLKRRPDRFLSCWELCFFIDILPLLYPV